VILPNKGWGRIIVSKSFSVNPAIPLVNFEMMEFSSLDKAVFCVKSIVGGINGEEALPPLYLSFVHLVFLW